MVAVPVKHAESPGLEPGLRISFRVQFDHLNPVRGHIGQERNIVLLGHGMADRHKTLILHPLNGDHVLLIRFLRLQRRQRNATAADQRVSGAVHHIAGMQRAGTVIAINPDKNAPIFDYADFGIVAEFH